MEAYEIDNQVEAVIVSKKYSIPTMATLQVPRMPRMPQLNALTRVEVGLEMLAVGLEVMVVGLEVLVVGLEVMAVGLEVAVGQVGQAVVGVEEMLNSQYMSAFRTRSPIQTPYAIDWRSPDHPRTFLLYGLAIVDFRLTSK